MGQDVIMNSLVGCQMNPDLIEMVKEQVLIKLKQRVAPEFINRIDDVVMFLPLSQEDIKKIVSLQLEALKKRLKQNDIDINFEDSAIAFIAQKGYKPEYGGRPVKRAIKEYVIDALSLSLLRQEVVKSFPIRVAIASNNIVIINN